MQYCVKYGGYNTPVFPVVFAPFIIGFLSGMIFFWGSWRPLVKSLLATGFMIVNDLIIRFITNYRSDNDVLSWVAFFMVIGLGIQVIKLLIFLFFNRDEIERKEIFACVSLSTAIPMVYLYCI